MDPLVAAALGAVAGAVVVLAFSAARDHDREDRHRTEVRTLEESLVRQERSSHATLQIQDVILSSMQDGVLLIGPDGDAVFANEALVRHVGTRPGSAAQLFPVALRESVERVRDGRDTDSVLVEVADPPRTLRAVTALAGEAGAVLLVVRDVTEARRIDAIRRDFVANASHELKTPAASIQAAAETLRHAAEDDPGAVQRFTAQLEREALRLSRIVADLLDLSRLESGSELSERVHLEALAREEAERHADVARAAEIALAVASSGPSVVRGSARDLSLMIRNLVDNAVRYTGRGGSVTIDVSHDERLARLSVADTGVGIPSKDLSRVFERFYRVDRARSRETGGTGLGLAIAKHVAENHGGSISLESELARGTVVTVQLPLAS